MGVLPSTVRRPASAGLRQSRLAISLLDKQIVLAPTIPLYNRLRLGLNAGNRRADAQQSRHAL
jgi:hypothetical protein